jgi:redox-sensitive bicupin YhaK (pirin superfamily)
MTNASHSTTLQLRRSRDRGFEDFGWTDHWMTFSFGGYHDPKWMNFGPLRVMVENHIQPHSGFPTHPHRDVEVLTYVVSGTLTHSDSFGHHAEITAGEMQLISAGHRGMMHAEENRHDRVEHNYQMWLIPNRTGTQFDYHQLKFTPSERQGQLRLYVSPDGRDGSMPINTDALIYAGLFTAGDRLTYTVSRDRGIWLQIVTGSVNVTGLSLETGDGIGITDTSFLELAFQAPSEILLFDLGMTTPRIW